jgi:hypothetical protein
VQRQFVGAEVINSAQMPVHLTCYGCVIRVVLRHMQPSEHSTDFGLVLTAQACQNTKP